MKPVFDFKKIRRIIKIYAVVQVILLALLVYMALYFQASFQASPFPHRFFKSIVITLIIQLAMFYPINKFAGKEAEREVSACGTDFTPEEMKGLRNKRMIGDIIKMSVFIFFGIFIWRAPSNIFVLSVLFFSFVLTVLSYFQCFNFAARRQMREKG